MQRAVCFDLCFRRITRVLGWVDWSQPEWGQGTSERPMKHSGQDSRWSGLRTWQWAWERLVDERRTGRMWWVTDGRSRGWEDFRLEWLGWCWWFPEAENAWKGNCEKRQFSLCSVCCDSGHLHMNVPWSYSLGLRWETGMEVEIWREFSSYVYEWAPDWNGTLTWHPSDDWIFIFFCFVHKLCTLINILHFHGSAFIKI